jgi:hypothetical protein
LWLDLAALLKFDRRRLQQTLHLGQSSAEYVQFVQQVEARGKS